MPLMTCCANLNFHFSDLRSLLPRRDTYMTWIPRGAHRVPVHVGRQAKDAETGPGNNQESGSATPNTEQPGVIIKHDQRYKRSLNIMIMEYNA